MHAWAVAVLGGADRQVLVISCPGTQQMRRCSIHVTTCAKGRRFDLRLWHDLLGRQGVFVMVDVLRAPGEALEAYQGRSQADVRGIWSGSLTEDEVESFRDHMLKVQAYSLPKSALPAATPGGLPALPQSMAEPMPCPKSCKACCLGLLGLSCASV